MVLLGVNGIGLEAGNAEMTAGRTLPWLQDVAAVDAWTAWGVTYRDVVVVDRTGVRRTALNLTTYDLAQPGNVALLKALLLEAR